MPWPGLAINQALTIHHCAMKKGQKGREDITKKLPLAAAHLTYKYPQRTQRKAKGKEIQFQQTGSCDIPKYIGYMNSHSFFNVCYTWHKSL